MNIAIYSRVFKESHLPYLPELLNKLYHLGYQLVVYEPYYHSFKDIVKDIPPLSLFNTHEDLHHQADILISIGGDGTILDCVKFIRDSNIPVAAINDGRLGFLADIQKEKTDNLIHAIHNHIYDIEERVLLHVDASDNGIFGDLNFGLNEVTLHKTDTSSMIVVHTYLNGEFLNSFWADGLIVATPTGSTAYSLSCNGPIIMPIANAFVLTPVAPHNLNARPLVVPDTSILSFEVETRSNNYLCSIDSRYEKVDESFKIAVRKEAFTFKLLRLHENSYIHTLRHKLMWGEDIRN
ncbi:MAG: NAD kinase [Chitinophagales bacterium]|nr:NAD kinase [Chitinophagales bacterium]